MLLARRGYAIRDSKLAAADSGTILQIRLQLETYGWLYEQNFGEAAGLAQVHAGSGEILDVPYEEEVPTRSRKLERILELRLRRRTHLRTARLVAKCSSVQFTRPLLAPGNRGTTSAMVAGVDRGLVA